MELLGLTGRNQSLDNDHLENARKARVQECGRQVAMDTKFRTAVPRICGYSVRNLLCVTLLAPRILRWPPDCSKICEPLIHCDVCTLTNGADVSDEPTASYLEFTQKLWYRFTKPHGVTSYTAGLQNVTVFMTPESHWNCVSL